MVSGELALEVSELEMRFGPVTALRNVSISIRQGEIHGVVGHNGSGKSTFVEILAGTHVPTNGKMELFGKEVGFPGAAKDRLSYPMAVVHQDVGLVGSMSVVDNFRVNRFNRGPAGALRWREERKLTRERLAALGLDIDPRTLVEELSAADQVLISVARSLMDLEQIRQKAEHKDQAILILDEPTSSLPSGAIDSFLGTIREVNRDLGTTVIIVSHNPREIMALSNRFSALKNGALVGTYVTGEVSYQELAALMSGQNENEIDHKVQVPTSAVRQFDVRRSLRPVMERLNVSTQETVHLAVAVHSQIMDVEVIDSPQSIGVRHDIGSLLPIHATSVGKIFLAFSSHFQNLLSSGEIALPRLTPNTITDSEELFEEIEKIARQGYSLNLGGRSEYTAGAAVPIFGLNGELVAALGVSGPITRYPSLDDLEHLAQEIIQEVQHYSVPQILNLSPE